MSPTNSTVSDPVLAAHGSLPKAKHLRKVYQINSRLCNATLESHKWLMCPMSIFRGLTLLISSTTSSHSRSQEANGDNTSFRKSRKGTTMSSFTHPIVTTAPFARSVAIAALMGATILASPLPAARADTVTNTNLAIQLAQPAAPQNRAGAEATETKGETVEQRITD